MLAACTDSMEGDLQVVPADPDPGAIAQTSDGQRTAELLLEILGGVCPQRSWGAQGSLNGLPADPSRRPRTKVHATRRTTDGPVPMASVEPDLDSVREVRGRHTTDRVAEPALEVPGRSRLNDDEATGRRMGRQIHDQRYLAHGSRAQDLACADEASDGAA